MKLLLLLLSLSLVLSLQAQDRIYQEHIGWKGEEIELHTISDSGKTVHCLFLSNADSIRGFLLDERQRILQHFQFRLMKDEQFRGGFIGQGKVNVFLQSPGADEHLHVWELDMAGGGAGDYTIPFGRRHEQAVAEISCGNHFVYFTCNKKTSVFAIYDFRGSQRYDTLYYHFDDPIWMALNKWYGPGMREMNVVVIDPDDQMNPAIAYVPNKLYWSRDSLFLLMNSYERGVTWIYSFDMRSKKVDLRKIIHNNARIWNPPLELYQDNSMLFDHKLYFVSAQDTQLSVQVRDFYSGRRLAMFTAGKDDAINFKNTPIVSGFDDSNRRQLRRTSQLLWEMVAGKALIMVNREDSGRVSLVVGAWSNKVYHGPALVASGALFWPLAIAGTAVFISDLTAMRNPRFKMLLDTATLRHVSGTIPPDPEDRIETLTKGIRIPEQGENLFEHAGKQVFAYYDKRTREIVLVSL